MALRANAHTQPLTPAPLPPEGGEGRKKTFAVLDDEHLLTVLRYVERNPLPAGLVARAEAWPWSSLCGWAAGTPAAFLDPGPLPRGDGWTAWVNEPLSAIDLARVRHSVERGAPFGDDAWVRQTAERLGLQSTLCPRGRPRKPPKAP